MAMVSCRTDQVHPVPGSTLTCLKTVADRKLAYKLDLVETDGALHGCQVCNTAYQLHIIMLLQSDFHASSESRETTAKSCLT